MTQLSFSAPGKKRGLGRSGEGGQGPCRDQGRPTDTSSGRRCNLPSWRLISNADHPLVSRGHSTLLAQGIAWGSPYSKGGSCGVMIRSFEGVLVCLMESAHPLTSWDPRLGFCLPVALPACCRFCTLVPSHLHHCVLPVSAFVISLPLTQPSHSHCYFLRAGQAILLSTQKLQTSPWTTESGPRSVADISKPLPSALKPDLDLPLICI